jgi:hypothetical protein
MTIATRAGVADSVAAMRRRLELYQAGQPYREAFTNAPPGAAARPAGP